VAMRGGVGSRGEVNTGDEMLERVAPRRETAYEFHMNARTKRVVGEVPEDAPAAWGDVIRRRADDVLAGRDRGPECRPFLAELRMRLRSGMRERDT